MPESENKGLLSNFNLPTAFGGRAGDALSRLIGVPINAVAARLERGEANIVARTDGQAAFQRIVADAAAQEAIKNPEFMQRAIETFGRDLVQAQINRDKIATEAVLHLESEHTEVDDEKFETSEPVSQDWLNHFSSHAGKVSSEEMQMYWGQLLAGEIRKPGRFSLSTMRILSEIDVELARLFAKRIHHNLNGGFIHKRPKDGMLDAELLLLEDSGFVSGTKGLGLLKTYGKKQKGGFVEVYKDHMLKINCEDKTEKMSLPIVMLTRAGQDILSFVPQKSAVELGHFIANLGVKEIINVEVFSMIKVENGTFRSNQLIEKCEPK